jgi:pSer/pThr/pTyr-binding forkhead associated (FHA) protein
VIMGANAGQIYTVTKPRTVLGRGTDSDIQLQDSEVSRRHAMLEIRGDEAMVVDMGSTNGTYVDGVRVQKASIFSNQEFSLGTTTLMFIVTDMHDGSMDA